MHHYEVMIKQHYHKRQLEMQEYDINPVPVLVYYARWYQFNNKMELPRVGLLAWPTTATGVDCGWSHIMWVPVGTARICAA